MLRRIHFALVALVVLFLLLPVFSIAVSSVSKSALFVFPPSGFTWKWYAKISPVYLDALRVSAIVAVGSTAVALLVGIPAGIGLVRGRLPMVQEISALFLSPLAVPTLIVGVAVFQFSSLLWSTLGFPIAGTAYGLILGHSTFTVPFVIRAMIAGQNQYDRSVEEAAASLGASALSIFLTVTLPMLSPAIVSGAIFALLTSFDDVPVALFVGGGDATTLPVSIFNAVQFNLSPDLMALCTAVSIGILILLMLCSRFIGVERFFGTSHT
jgi:putative spermidine/putrescine transport system permease protein